MNERIANLIALELVELPFLTKCCGCVKILTTRDKKKFPISTLVHFESEEMCEQEDGYVLMTPESKQTGVSFFEDLGTNPGPVGSTVRSYKGSLKLTVWINRDKIGDDTPTHELKYVVLAAVHGLVVPSDGFSLVSRMKVVQEYPESPSAFAKYSFDEERTQFLSPPYDHFSFKVQYTAAVSKNCAPTITLNPKQC